jgi:hypothetical protein
MTHLSLIAAAFGGAELLIIAVILFVGLGIFLVLKKSNASKKKWPSIGVLVFFALQTISFLQIGIHAVTLFCWLMSLYACFWFFSLSRERERRQSVGSRVAGYFLFFIGIELIPAAVFIAAPSREGEGWSVRTLVPFLLILLLAVFFFSGARHFVFERVEPSSEQPPPEADKKEIVEEVKDGIPCVACEKRIAVGSKNCPFCGWTQP